MFASSRKLVAILFVALLTLLTACASPPPPSTVTPSPTPGTVPSRTPTLVPSPVPSLTPLPISPICSPLKDHAFNELPGYVTQPFISPLGANRETGHHGVDISYYRRDGVGAHIEGTPVQSVLDGTVAALGANPVYGNYLIVETPSRNLPVSLLDLYALDGSASLYFLYAHMQDLAPFNLGDTLDCAQQVGAVGDSGDQFFVSDPHLHFEIRVGPSGIQFAPMSFYDTSATEEEKTEFLFWRTGETFNLHDPMLLLNFAAE